MLLDSGASCLVVTSKCIPVENIRPISGVQLINADGRSVSPIRTAMVNISLENLHAEHPFMVLDDLSSTALLGCDSPWRAPAVYVPKSNGELRICVDFVQLNRVTKKNSYPIPRTEGPQQKLSGKCVFSKLDL